MYIGRIFNQARLIIFLFIKLEFNVEFVMSPKKAFFVANEIAFLGMLRMEYSTLHKAQFIYSKVNIIFLLLIILLLAPIF